MRGRGELQLRLARVASELVQIVSMLESLPDDEPAPAPAPPPAPPPPAPKWAQGRVTLSIKEAAGAIGVSKATVYAMIKRGELEVFKWGGRTLIRRDDLVAAVDRASGR